MFFIVFLFTHNKGKKNILNDYKTNKMTQREIIDAISTLSEVVKANNNFMFGSEQAHKMANTKIKELIPLINKQNNL